mmetsp:Transcript_19738/g.29898  ORF Transcript_19738/g.29898 Transcript_19738/m.29898 type:complete len:83 (+) Transcript_19738:637-885(+)
MTSYTCSNKWGFNGSNISLAFFSQPPKNMQFEVGVTYVKMAESIGTVIFNGQNGKFMSSMSFQSSWILAALLTLKSNKGIKI